MDNRYHYRPCLVPHLCSVGAIYLQFEKNLLKESLSNLLSAIMRKSSPTKKEMSNRNDISIYLDYPRTPSQRGLNEHSNGLLRKDDLPKTMDFTQVD